MSLEITLVLGSSALILFFLIYTRIGRTAFKAGFGFFVGSAMVLSAAGTIASAVLVILLLEPSLQPALEVIAPWYTFLSVGCSIVAGFVAAVRAVRLG